jgi:hypothetical protein
MRKVYNILLAGFTVLAGWSCTEDIMDDINKNVNDPTDVASNLIITDVMTSSAFNVTGSDLAFYASCYIEHNVGIYGQMYSAEIRSSEPQSSTTYNNAWGAMYRNLYNLKIIIDKCSTGGSEEGNYQTLGIAQILSAYNLAYLTDLMGDVPWSEALQPGIIFTPKLDAQADIYDAIFTFLNNGIENLGKETTFSSLGSQDFIYGGDSGLWIKFAYGLKARYTMRLSLRDAAYEDVITNADKSFTSSDEQCQFDYNGNTSKSPFYSFYTDRDYFGASQSFHDKLADRDDPRDAIFFVAHPDADALVFAPNGRPKEVQGYYGISGITDIMAPTYLLSYHEIEFLKAEAYVRLGNLTDAETALKSGIEAAFAKENIGLSTTEADEYYENSVKAKFTASPLSEVMIQKYIAFFEEEAVEAYNDYRRLVAMGNNVINLDNSGQFPLRYSYGSDDVTTNSNVSDAYGDGSYVYTENVWWAGGSR